MPPPIGGFTKEIFPAKYGKKDRWSIVEEIKMKGIVISTTAKRKENFDWRSLFSRPPIADTRTSPKLEIQRKKLLYVGELLVLALYFVSFFVIYALYEEAHTCRVLAVKYQDNEYNEIIGARCLSVRDILTNEGKFPEHWVEAAQAESDKIWGNSLQYAWISTGCLGCIFLFLRRLIRFR